MGRRGEVLRAGHEHVAEGPRAANIRAKETEKEGLPMGWVKIILANLLDAAGAAGG